MCDEHQAIQAVNGVREAHRVDLAAAAVWRAVTFLLTHKVTCGSSACDTSLCGQSVRTLQQKEKCPTCVLLSRARVNAGPYSQSRSPLVPHSTLYQCRATLPISATQHTFYQCHTTLSISATQHSLSVPRNALYQCHATLSINATQHYQCHTALYQCHTALPISATQHSINATQHSISATQHSISATQHSISATQHSLSVPRNTLNQCHAHEFYLVYICVPTFCNRLNASESLPYISCQARSLLRHTF